MFDSTIAQDKRLKNKRMNDVEHRVRQEFKDAVQQECKDSWFDCQPNVGIIVGIIPSSPTSKDSQRQNEDYIQSTPPPKIADKVKQLPQEWKDRCRMSRETVSMVRSAAKRRADEPKSPTDTLQESSSVRLEFRKLEDPITVIISKFSGAIWFEATIQNYETIASVLETCPQPQRKWPGDRSVLYKLVFGTRMLREGDIVGDLFDEQAAADGSGTERKLNLTLCVESLRVATTRLKNKVLHRP